ncbi:hypothetical protein [Streptomyces sp. CHB9.2]|uniref:hypothetical protein n=1 Tax=Streptomyces sp. CHB9.2 TaxID=2841670 RepID=UPI0020948B5D|nr:hypothetical protein [Streptomyces sp. CHB9.2]MCO6704838.1 hypothetical protein [Streptomyces sp. CHB9.2]
MNLIQSLFVRGAQEAGELVGVFTQLAAMGPKALDQAGAPVVSTEDGEEGGEAMGQPLVLKAIKEMNEILAAVELLRDRGIPLAGIGDPVAVGEAKNMIIKCMEQSMADGQLVLTDEDKNPRPEGVNEPNTGLPEDGGDGGAGDAGNGGYDDGSAGGAADGDEAGDTSGGDTGAGDEGQGDGTGDAGDGGDTGAGDGDTGGEGDGGEGAGDGEGDEGDDDEDAGNTDGDDDENEEEEEEEEPGSNDV